MTTPISTGNRQARDAALNEQLINASRAAAVVEFVSAGKLLILGEQRLALSAANQLSPGLTCTLHESGSRTPQVEHRNDCNIITGGDLHIDGWLGSFDVHIEHNGVKHALTQLLPGSGNSIDLVLDLSPTPYFSRELKPLGYYHVRDAHAHDAAPALETVIAELQNMRGTFEKPKFFELNTEICAHGRNGQPGCTRCIDACPAEAIHSAGDHVDVNPYLCQGGGSCATACPTGAISYTLPSAQNLLIRVRRLLKLYTGQGGRTPYLVFHDSSSSAYSQQLLELDGAEHIIPIAVEEIGCVGMEACLASLAYGADRVWLLKTSVTPPKVVRELEAQAETARAILAGLGHQPEILRVIDSQVISPETLIGLASPGKDPRLVSAEFEALGGKRALLKLAITHLCDHAPDAPEVIPLPTQSPFGEIIVDRDACTLCMGCVGVCPSQALHAGNERPALSFAEWNCVQCGLCASACPEQAIQLNPRLVTDTSARQQQRLLHEDEALPCLRCGTPVATRAMLGKLKDKLAGHKMFQTDAAQRRMQMCADCRVKDIVASDGMPA